MGIKATAIMMESYLKGELAIGTTWAQKQKNNAYNVRSNSPSIITELCTGLDSLS